MIEPVVVGLRLLQYLGAMLLMGASLFFVYSGSPATDRESRLTAPRRLLLIVAAAVLAVASLAAIVAQSSLFAGSLTGGIDTNALRAVGFGMKLGLAALVRAGAATVALGLLLILPSGRVTWMATAALGSVATVSLAWLGHAAAAEGPLGAVHLASDVLHVTAAAVWIGALFGLLQLLLASPQGIGDRQEVHAALHRFSGIGSLVVAILLLTGLVNSWMLVGPDHLAGLWTTRYGQFLIVKIVLFGAMIGLATVNRLRLTPALGDAMSAATPSRHASSALRRSIALETILGVAVLFLVAWFGTMAPPAST